MATPVAVETPTSDARGAGGATDDSEYDSEGTVGSLVDFIVQDGPDGVEVEADDDDEDEDEDEDESVTVSAARGARKRPLDVDPRNIVDGPRRRCQTQRYVHPDYETYMLGDVPEEEWDVAVGGDDTDNEEGSHVDEARGAGPEDDDEYDPDAEEEDDDDDDDDDDNDDDDDGNADDDDEVAELEDA